MMVANKANPSGILRLPFFLTPPGTGFPAAVHNSIRLDISSAPLGFGRMRSNRGWSAHTRARIWGPAPAMPRQGHPHPRSHLCAVGADVRFGAHYGLKPETTPLPKSANNGSHD